MHGEDGALAVETLGRNRQVALVRSRGPSDAGLVDRSCLERLGDRLWLLGEVRLDGPAELRRRLASAGVADADTAGQARLCLLAYERWGESCLDVVFGDFAFVVWDEHRQSLFAARDRLGKRPLFHGRDKSTGVVGNSLDWVVAAAAPSRAVDEYWIADFLTQGCSREMHRTAYRDIRRVASGHCLRWSAEGDVDRRYWRLDVAEPLYLPRREDYLVRFRESVAQAVADRTSPAGDVGISMSGGLDSTTLAAIAARQAGDPHRVSAVCVHLEAQPDLQEDAFASMAARHLGIDLRVVPYDELSYDPAWQSRGIRPAEPLHGIVNAHHVRTVNDSMAARCAVWFEGEGPDNALAFDRDPYLSWLVGRGDWWRLAGTLVSYAMVKGSGGWLETLRRHRGRPAAAAPAPAAEQDPVPRWLAPGFRERLRLQQRIDDLGDGGDGSHPWHPQAFRSFTSPVWQRHFADYAFEEALSPLQWQHPFFDLRVLQFLLAVPPIPWAWKKTLLREAMRGWLPDPVLRRPKTGVGTAPVAIALARHGMPAPMAPARLDAYVDRRLLPASDGPQDEVLQATTAYALDHWLATLPAT